MKYYTVKEIANLWGVSEQLVRRYCRQDRIPKAICENDCWLIPEGSQKPGAPVKRDLELSPLMKKILYQKVRNNHFGIYEYIQVNLAYSSCRMASNRLTKIQVLDIYRTNKLCHNFEYTKVDDIIEIVGHFDATRLMLDTIMEPLTQNYIKKLHYQLTYGTFADRQKKVTIGAYRKAESKINGNLLTPPNKINVELGALIKDYERETATLQRIIDFHVRFERIRPFADYNGRVGRLIMLKECLRYGIDPFIIDDKRRSEYNRGIAVWDEDPSVLTGAILQAQNRFQNQMDTCRLMQYCLPQW